MTTYEVRLYSNNGRLYSSPEYSKLPQHISNIVIEKSKKYTSAAADISGFGFRFHVLNSGLEKTWNYTCDSDNVTITFDLDVFDSKYMRILK